MKCEKSTMRKLNDLWASKVKAGGLSFVDVFIGLEEEGICFDWYEEDETIFFYFRDKDSKVATDELAITNEEFAIHPDAVARCINDFVEQGSFAMRRYLRDTEGFSK
jgi:hypothetical protein